MQRYGEMRIEILIPLERANKAKFEVDMHSGKLVTVNHTLRFKLQENCMVHSVKTLESVLRQVVLRKTTKKRCSIVAKKGRNLFFIFE